MLPTLDVNSECIGIGIRTKFRQLLYGKTKQKYYSCDIFEIREGNLVCIGVHK